MLSSTFLGIAVRNDTRVAMPKINQEELSGILVAVPPLAEQRRIVGKVDQLLGLCDELASRQEAVRQASEKLLDAAIQSLLSEVGSHAKPRREQARMIQFLFASPRLRVTLFVLPSSKRLGGSLALPRCATPWRANSNPPSPPAPNSSPPPSRTCSAQTHAKARREQSA